jgi:hypothetical protein
VAILVDDARWHWRGRVWAHLVSDTSYAELHAFAARLGIPRRAFQGDHYDVPEEYREAAIGLGAAAVDSRYLIRRLRASGLRLSPAQRRQLPRQVATGGGIEGQVSPVGEIEAIPTGKAADES